MGYSEEQKRWARQLLAALTYRPSWELGLEFDGQGRLVLHLRAPAEDSQHRLEAAEIRISRIVDGWVATEDNRAWFLRVLVAEINEMIRDLEDHERLEWLQAAGASVYPAHTPDGLSLTTPSRPADLETLVPDTAPEAQDYIWERYSTMPYLYGRPAPRTAAELKGATTIY